MIDLDLRTRGVAAVMALALALAAAPALAQPPAGNPPGASLDELLALVEKFNPELAAAALESEAAAARIEPAGALEDPMFEVSRNEAMRLTMFMVSQRFPLWGKRDLRASVAAANADAVKSRESDVAKQLAERLKVVFAQYYETTEAIRVTEEIRDLLRTVASTARTRYGQGLVNQADAIRADLEVSRLDTDLAALARIETTVKARINALTARPANAPLARPQRLPAVPSVDALSLTRLVAQARDGNPLLAATKADIAAANGARQLVEKSYYPDVTVTLGGGDPEDRSTQVLAGIGIEIPLQWGTRESQAREANATRAAAEKRLDAQILDIESEIEAALAALRESERTGELLQTTLMPQSEAAYRSALASYQLGRGDLTSILDAARRLFEIELELLRVGTEAQTAIAAVERQIGGAP